MFIYLVCESELCFTNYNNNQYDIAIGNHQDIVLSILSDEVYFETQNLNSAS